MRNRGRQLQALQQIADRCDGYGSVLDQTVTAIAARAENRAGNGEDIPPLFTGKAGRYQSAAALSGFHNDHCQTHSADNSIAGRKVAGFRLRAQRILTDQCAALDDLEGKTAIPRRVNLIDAAAQDGNRASACFERSFVSDGIHAQRQPAYNGYAMSGQSGCQFTGDFFSVRGYLPCAYNADGKFVLLFKLSAHV